MKVFWSCLVLLSKYFVGIVWVNKFLLFGSSSFKLQYYALYFQSFSQTFNANMKQASYGKFHIEQIFESIIMHVWHKSKKDIGKPSTLVSGFSYKTLFFSENRAISRILNYYSGRKRQKKIQGNSGDKIFKFCNDLL